MNNKIFKYAGYAITFIAFIFIVKAFMSMKIDVKYIKSPISAIVLGVLLSIGYVAIVYISSYAWKTTLEFINKGKIPFHEILTVYSKSNIGKYVPGNVMQFAGRNILAGKLGFKQLDITFCSIIEIGMLLATDCILSLIFAMKSFKSILKDVFYKIHPGMLYGIVIVVIIIVTVVIWLLITKSTIIKNYKHFFTKGFLVLLCKLFCIYSITLIIPGIFLVLILQLVLGASISLPISLIIISGYTISWVLGFVVPGAPGGIGIRESIMLLMLGPIFTNNIVLLAAILLRITSTVGDILAFLLSPYAFIDKS